jgi:hypothetical protein
MWFEIVRPARGTLTALLGQPVRTVAIVTHGGADGNLSVLRADAVSGRVQILTLSPETAVALPGQLSTRLDAAVLDVLCGDESAIGPRVRALASAITQLPVDDFIAGSSRVMARVSGSSDERAVGRVRAVMDVARLKWATVVGSARMSLSVFALWGLMRKVQEARSVDMVAAHGASDEPIVIRQEAWSAASSQMSRGRGMWRSGRDARARGADWRSWMP